MHSKEKEMKINGFWNLWWVTPDGKREIWMGNVSYARASAHKLVFPWLSMKLVRDVEA